MFRTRTVTTKIWGWWPREVATPRSERCLWRKTSAWSSPRWGRCARTSIGRRRLRNTTDMIRHYLMGQSLTAALFKVHFQTWSVHTMHCIARRIGLDLGITRQYILLRYLHCKFYSLVCRHLSGGPSEPQVSFSLLGFAPLLVSCLGVCFPL